jgi:hypothetical protein
MLFFSWTNISDLSINFANLILERLFIMNVYQWTSNQLNLLFGSTENLRENVRNNPNFFKNKVMDLASQQCTYSHGTVFNGVFSY